MKLRQSDSKFPALSAISEEVSASFETSLYIYMKFACDSLLLSNPVSKLIVFLNKEIVFDFHYHIFMRLH